MNELADGWGGAVGMSVLIDHVVKGNSPPSAATNELADRRGEPVGMSLSIDRVAEVAPCDDADGGTAGDDGS